MAAETATPSTSHGRAAGAAGPRLASPARGVAPRRSRQLGRPESPGSSMPPFMNQCAHSKCAASRSIASRLPGSGGPGVAGARSLSSRLCNSLFEVKWSRWVVPFALPHALHEQEGVTSMTEMFDEVLAICLDRLTDGDTIDQCVDDYPACPELRETLEVAELLMAR